MKVIHERFPLLITHILKMLCVGILGIALIAAGFGAWYYKTYQGKFIEGVYIDSIEVSERTKDEALVLLQQQTQTIEGSLTLNHEALSATASAQALGVHAEYQQTIDQAFQLGRSSNVLLNISTIINTALETSRFTAPLVFEEQKVKEFATTFSTQVNTTSQLPSATLTSGQISIFPGKIGKALNVDKTTSKIMQTPFQPSLKIESEVEVAGFELSADQLQQAQQRAQQYIGKTIVAKADTIAVSIGDSELIPVLAFPNGFNDPLMQPILEKVKNSIERPAQNAVFIYDPTTLKVSEFKPDLDGLTLNDDVTKQQLQNIFVMIEQGATEAIIPIEIQFQAKKADLPLESLNTLGIKERIGLGESYYKGSIATRVHNVSNASNILNNYIVKPGEEFSFNNALGDVSAATGFKPAYIIQAGRTVLGDGGGVCQVSTTLFRALLDSGLTISKRRPHSYRVGYYEQDGRVGSYYMKDQPGFDATVFSGDVDLRFINDSPGHVLIHFDTNADTQHMIVMLYGTSDGRRAEVSEYKKWDARRALAPQYFDDPTLPPGKIVQIDWAVSGITSSFKHTVIDKNGNLIKETTYFSKYVPWAAKYRRGV